MKGIKRFAGPFFLILSAILAIGLCAHAQAVDRAVAHLVSSGVE